MQAIYFGTFAPLHQGHISNIIYAKRKYQQVIIVVSGYQKDRGDQVNMSLFDRYRLIREIYRDDALVDVVMIDETKITKIPDGWDQWLDLIEQQIKNSKKKMFICAEKDYQIEFQNRGYQVDLLSRTEINISATDIRNNPYQNWQYINKYFKKFFTKKVLIYGTASTGKTTLTKDLANYFNTSFSLEYAREYEDNYNVLDNELDIRDLTNIGIGQFNNNKHHINSPATNKIFFADTDVMTTLNYLEVYNQADEKYEAVKSIFEGLIEKQRWDLVLFLQPDTKYRDDGFRDMAHANDEVRQEMNNKFKQRLEDYQVNYVELTGNYYQKFENAKKLASELLID